jgi:hypothetical protein
VRQEDGPGLRPDSLLEFHHIDVVGSDLRFMGFAMEYPWYWSALMQ